MLIFIPGKEILHEFTYHIDNLDRFHGTILPKNNLGVHFRNTVPDRFSEITTQIFNGILQKTITIDQINIIQILLFNFFLTNDRGYLGWVLILICICCTERI